MNWHKITTDQANEIISINKKGTKVSSLEEYASELINEAKNQFENVVGQDSLTRFDSPKPNNKRKNKRTNKNRRKTQNTKNNAK